MAKDTKTKTDTDAGAPPATKERRPARRPTLDDGERGLLVKHHLDLAAEALGLNPEAGDRIGAAQWADAIDHYNRAAKLAGGDPRAALLPAGDG